MIACPGRGYRNLLRPPAVRWTSAGRIRSHPWAAPSRLRARTSSLLTCGFVFTWLFVAERGFYEGMSSSLRGSGMSASSVLHSFAASERFILASVEMGAG
jgi:hypothetical protein